MAVMTAQQPLALLPAGAVQIGQVAALVEDQDGGRVFIRGELVFAWDDGDEPGRRLAAVQLVRVKAARAVAVAAGFEVNPETLRRWDKAVTGAGVAALVSARRGPKGPTRLTQQVVADIRARRRGGATLRAIAAAVGVAEASVRRALGQPSQAGHQGPPPTAPAALTVTAKDTILDGNDGAGDPDAGEAGAGGAGDLPVLPAPADRCGERAAARWGQLVEAPPVFVPAARVPLAGLLLAMPALEATGLLSCATTVFGALSNGFYGLDTMLVEVVLRALAGEPRAEGATRVDPVALGRVLGLDRAPEVKTIRRKIAALAGTGKAEELQAAMARRHVARLDGTAPELAAVFYLDGHVRAYHGTKQVAKTHLARLRFPAPATVETWVSDAAGDPVLVVMAEPGASLAGELRRLLPQLRAAVGDQRRVLVGFDRGGWSPALFAHMHAAGFDVLTWRKGPAPDVPPQEFTDLTHLDENGRTHCWRAAETTVDLPTSDDGQGTFTMRQVTLQVANTKTGREDGQGCTRQMHILTTRTDLTSAEVIYRMGSRWRQENYFRYARMHFDLDSHDAYTAAEDDPTRLVPNPAKKKAHRQVLAARAAHERALAATDAALLQAFTPPPGGTVLITNTDHDAITADLRQAETDLDDAQTAHRAIPTRLPLGDVNPGQQILDTQTKLLTHTIQMAAFNTITALARAIPVHTGYARADDEAHTLIRQALTGSGDIDPTRDGVLTVRLDPLPTKRATTAIAELCQHLTATETRYPGTNLLLRYEVKTRP